jgi:hypothetical protein
MTTALICHDTTSLEYHDLAFIDQPETMQFVGNDLFRVLSAKFAAHNVVTDKTAFQIRPV